MYISELLTVVGYLHTAGFKNHRGINFAKCSVKHSITTGTRWTMYQGTLKGNQVSRQLMLNEIAWQARLKGVLHLWTLFLKTLCIFSKNKATSDKVSHGSGQKCSKELKNHSFTSVETIVVKLQ